jgi:hypothetical protein
MLLDKSVELRVGQETINIENPSTNLSMGGLFVRRCNLPVGTAVRVRIAAGRGFEADGQIRNCATNDSGVGIGFNSLTERDREALYELIEDLTLRGLPAA